MGIDLYAKIEPYLDFQNEISALHNHFLKLVLHYHKQNVIDIGCGQGSFMELLNTHNIKTFGVDISINQIKQAQAKNLNVACVDIANIKEKFECATAIFDVLNYIPQKQLIDFFKNVANILQKNGLFFFDVNTKYGFENIAQGSLNISKKEHFIGIDAIYEANTLTTSIDFFTTQNTKTYTRESGEIKQFFHPSSVLIKSAHKAGLHLKNKASFWLHSDTKPDKEIYILELM